MKDSGKIFIKCSTRLLDRQGLRNESVQIFRMNNWLSFVILIPIGIAAVFFIAFFLSAFVALYLISGIAIVIWIWWLRWKLKKSPCLDGFEGEFTVFKETHNIEPEATNKIENKH